MGTWKMGTGYFFVFPHFMPDWKMGTGYFFDFKKVPVPLFPILAI